MKNILLLSLAVLLLVGCNANIMKGSAFNSVGANPQDSETGSMASSGGGGSAAAGGGADIPGSGTITVPTTDAIVARLQTSLGTMSTAGNFARSLAQVRPNLMKVSDPTKASGYDQVQLLVYAACSDLTGQMLTKYTVDPKKTIAQNSAALVSTGMQMLDRHVASLASQGPAAANVDAANKKLVDTLAADSTNTSTIAFMSVCMAANTAGLTLMGF